MKDKIRIIKSNIYTWFSNTWIRISYPVQDETWPSRRWTKNGDDYDDMCGYTKW